MEERLWRCQCFDKYKTALLRCSRRHRKTIFRGLCVLILWLCYISHGYDHWLAKDLRQFEWPLNINVPVQIQRMKEGLSTQYEPINWPNVTFLLDPRQQCACGMQTNCNATTQLLLIAVKSAPSHTDARNVIRRTWGQKLSFCTETALCYQISTVFFLGRVENKSAVQVAINAESDRHGDVAQGDFVDSYYMLTRKVLGAFHWIVTRCTTLPLRYILLVDDDSHISLPNLMLSMIAHSEKHQDSVFMGYQFSKIKPQRCRLSSMRYVVGLDVYPYLYYPPFITTGAVLFSHGVLETIYYASYFVKPYIFDDVYLGIIAFKLGIPTEHNEQFVSIHRRQPLGWDILTDPQTFYTKYEFASVISYDSIDPPDIIQLAFKRTCQQFYSQLRSQPAIVQSYVRVACKG